MDKFILNLIHRPELVPEYIDTSAQEGQTAEVSKANVVKESIDIFRLQQEIAHKNGLRTTIQMTYSSLYNDECIALVKKYHDEFNDEIGHTFLGVNCKEFREKYKSKELAIWLFSMDMKKRIVMIANGPRYVWPSIGWPVDPARSTVVAGVVMFLPGCF